MFKTTLFILIGLISTQDPELRKEIVKTYSDGSPKVILYFSEEEQSYVREEVFYKNGQMDYYGNYKNKLEHGEWKYFWQNGNPKFVEYYVNGLEHGTMYDYDWDGNPQKKYVYVHGELIEEVDLTNK